MSQAHTLPGRPDSKDSAPLSKTEQSRLVLTGTGAVVMLVLLIWLILGPWLPAPTPSDRYLALGFAPPEFASWLFSFSEEDSQRIGQIGTTITGRSWEPLGDLRQQVKRLEERRPGQPLILYLSAIGVSTSDQGRAYLVPLDGTPADESTLVPLADVLEILEERSKRPGKTLLILDAGQVGSDRGLGVFGNGFFKELESLVEQKANLLVLTSGAPGQLSWSAEPYHHSVFGYFVAEGLNQQQFWGGIDVEDLYKFVRSQVSQWVEVHRGATQTPQLLGDLRKHNFTLPRSNHKPLQPELPSAPPNFQEQLAPYWERHHALAEARPYRHAPLPWRQFNEELLRAERLLRAGRWAEVQRTLDHLDRLANEVGRQVQPAPLNSPWSLALLEASNPDAPSPRPAVEQEMQRLLTSQPAEAAARAPLDDLDLDLDDGVAEERSDPNACDEPEDIPAPPKPATPKPATPPVAAPKAPSVPSQFLAERVLAQRYEIFRKLGGESEELQPRRLPLLQRALELDAKAERAAAVDERIAPWVRPLVDAGDQLRLQAEDDLFADVRGPIDQAGTKLDQAEEYYDQVLAIAPRLVEALDLLQRVQDELPYYGEWLAHRSTRSRGTYNPLEAILDAAEQLAEVLDTPPDDLENLNALNRWTDPVRSQLGRLEDDYLRAAQQAAQNPERADWRELDALLRVPSRRLSVEDRMTLLAQVHSPERTPLLQGFPTSGHDVDDAAEADPAFWNQARILARLELGLLSITGADTNALKALYDSIFPSSGEPEATAETFRKLNSLSAQTRGLRDALFAHARTGFEASEPLTIEALRQAWSQADRIARVVPSGELQRRFLLNEPMPDLARLQRHEFLTWHGQRLAQNLLLDQSARLLTAAAETGINSQTLKQALDVQKRYAASDHFEVVHRADGAPDRQPADRYDVEVQGGRDLPAGRGLVMLTVRDINARPSIRPRNDTTETEAGGSLVEVTTDQDLEARRSFTVLNQADAVPLTPGVFYRGRLFAADREIMARATGELVSVVIRQKTEEGSIRIADQFEEHPNEGYIRPRGDLEYRLTLINNTSDPLDVVVVRQFDDEPVQTDRHRLDPNETKEAVIVDRVTHEDVADGEPHHLRIQATDEAGNPLNRPQTVVFRSSDPKQYLVVGMGFFESVHPRNLKVRGLNEPVPVFDLYVAHEMSDPVTAPVNVYAEVQPAKDVRLVGGVRNRLVGRGSTTVFRYIITDRFAPGLKWSLTVNGERNAFQDEIVLQREISPPIPPGIDPNNPAGQPPAPGQPPAAPAGGF